jgi:hypothetical protein
MKWSDSDKQTLQSEYPYTPPEILAEKLSRSPDSIKAQAHRMGISKVDNHEKAYSVVRADPINLDNISDETGYFIAGLVAGEGSFPISDDGRGYKKASFYVGMDGRDKDILNTLADVLDCGSVKERTDGAYALDISNIGELVLRVIPFFDEYGFGECHKSEQYQEWREWLLQRVPQKVELHKTTERP